VKGVKEVKMRLMTLAVVTGVAVLGVVPVPAAQTQTAAPNTLTPAETSAGWRLLFDGKTIDQWRGYKQQGVPTAFAVQDGAIVRVAGGPDLVSVDEYESFDFRFDWQLAAGANSGVMFRVTETEEQTYMTGIEYQILDNAGHPDGRSPLTSAGSCYGLYPPPKDVTRPIGAWNESRIVASGNKVEHWLNGEKTASYEIGSDEWNAKVAGSKFNAWKQFAKSARGRLAIQQHGGKVAFRNLKVKTN
jgi:hypothetical protein